MRNKLLITTALVAVMSATNVYAEDWTISSNETITDEIISKDKVTISGGDVSISGNNSGIIANGNFTMEDGSLTASSNGGSADTGVFVRGENSSVTIENGTINLTDSRIAKGEEDTNTTGDVNISGGKITLTNQAYIEMYDTNTGSVNLSDGELNINDNSGILLDGANNFTMTGGTVTMEQDSEILSMESNINISGGTIFMDKSDISADTKELNITGGKLDLKNGSNLWSDVGNINISGSDTSLTLDNSKIIIEPENYTQDSGDKSAITINGGNIELNNNSQIVAGATGTDGAPTSSNMSILIKDGIINFDKTSSISLTEKNTGDLNISGGTINGTEIGNYGKGNVNISGGEITATDIGAEQGSVTISNGTVNMVMLDGTDSEGLYARDNMTIKGGTINMSGKGINVNFT